MDAPYISEVTRWRGMDWPKDMPEHQRHLCLWKKWREPEFKHADFLNPVSEHVLEAAKMLYTPKQLVVHPWMEVQAHSWTYDDFFIWWGCAGSGKSHSLGLFALLDYLTDPDCTYTCLASTTKEMLAVRSFASVVQYLNYLKQNGKYMVPFKNIGQPLCVIPEHADQQNISDLKSKIVGVAVQQGTTEQARQNMQGVHTRYVRLLLDELAGLRPAAMEARHNLAQCPYFKLGGACNPESIYDQAGLYSEPSDGWSSVSVEDVEWKTPWGKVYRFDAFYSPGLVNPEKFWFLPTQDSIDRMVASNRGNEDAPAVWTFLRAFPPPQATERTVLTEKEIVTYNMKELCVWKDMPVKVGALDASYSAGGDNAVFLTALVGQRIDGVMTIMFDKTFYLEIKSSEDKPVREQLVDQVAEIIRSEEIDLYHVGIEDSGLQGMADAIEMKLGVGIYRSNNVLKPPDLPVSVTSQVTADKKYRDTVTWAWCLMQAYGSFGQIRGLPDMAGRQFCRRRFTPKAHPVQLETKKDYKKRTKASPDEGDASGVLLALCRERLGVMPGETEFQASATPPEYGETSSRLIKRYNNLDLEGRDRYTL